MNYQYTDLKVSKMLDKAARREMSRLALPKKLCSLEGWLVLHRGAAWPSMVHLLPPNDNEEARLSLLYEPPKKGTQAYIHALTWLDAIYFCEELLDYGITRIRFGGWYAERPLYPPNERIPSAKDTLLGESALVYTILERALETS